MKTREILTDEQIITAFGNADFGINDKRTIIANALLKYSCGYATGFTIEQICAELKLIGKTRNLTKTGKQYLYAAFSNKLSV